jgi:hypothetical protein
VPLFAEPAHAADVRVGVGITIGSNDPRYGTPYENGYGYGPRWAPTFRYGFDRGNAEGARDGYHDGSRGRRFELYREGDYHDADKGYHGWMGPRWEYARGYRRGYEQGYRQAYDQGLRRCHGEGYERRRHHGHYDRDDRYGRERADWDDEVIYESPRR